MLEASNRPAIATLPPAIHCVWPEFTVCDKPKNSSNNQLRPESVPRGRRGHMWDERVPVMAWLRGWTVDWGLPNRQLDIGKSSAHRPVLACSVHPPHAMDLGSSMVEPLLP
jgi:hypothetical protein